MKSLEHLFLEELARVYYAEMQWVHCLPKLAQASTDDELTETFDHHLSETEAQVEKVEELFRAFNQTPESTPCHVVDALVEAVGGIVAEHRNERTLNAALVAMAQKIEHHEIAAYGCLREWAEHLDNREAVEILDELLNEEKDADEKLTDIARDTCNDQAIADEETVGSRER